MKKYIFILVTLLVTGCSSNFLSNNKENLVNGVPQWVHNPKSNANEVVGIGIAPKNMKGAQAQRKSAISKAIDEIASQLGTTVNSIVQTSAHSDSNGNSNSALNTYSFQTVDGKTVTAFIKKTYKNPKNGVLYIMMVGKAK
jgi:hypothetical protein